MSSSKTDHNIARIQNVNVTEDTLSVDLDDGRSIAVPIGWYPRLQSGTPQERANWQLMGRGDGIHWPDLDEDISAENLVMGYPSSESQTSLRKWKEQRSTGSAATTT